MKHHFRVTLFLLGLFLLSQFLGLAIVSSYIDTSPSGEVTFSDLPLTERPDVNPQYSFIPLLVAVLVGTAIFLLIMRLKLRSVARGWHGLAIFLTLLFAFGGFFSFELAFVFAFVLTFLRILGRYHWAHLFSELFVYGGLGALLVPLLNLFSVSVLLILISLYDAWAVWGSKHMIKLAESQLNEQLFAGLALPYTAKGQIALRGKTPKKTKGSKKGRVALLGGGDIAFPLLFAGVILKDIGLWQALIIPFFVTIALGLLFVYAKPKKYYPAMPFVSLGCFVGLGVVWMISLLPFF